MSPRAFAALVGAIAILAGWIALCLDIHVETERGRPVACGKALVLDLEKASDEDRSGDLVRQCKDAAQTRRMIWWPVVALGGVVLVGAAVIRTAGSSGTVTPDVRRDSEGV